MRVIWLILLHFFLVSFCFGQKDTSLFLHKSLKKEIEKNVVGKDWKLLPANLDSVTEKFPFSGVFYTLKNCETEISVVYTGRVHTCRAGGCSKPGVKSADFNNSEFFDYYILFDKKLKVKSIKVYNYEATHGYEISVKGWLKQFIGYDGTSRLSVGKEVDAISGATISVNSITADIKDKTFIVNSVFKNLKK